jgi:hypothetical protein
VSGRETFCHKAPSDFGFTKDGEAASENVHLHGDISPFANDQSVKFFAR